MAPHLKVLHVTNTQFQSVVTYNSYRLVDRMQTCNEMMIAKTGKYVKRLETLMKAYKIDGKITITVMKFLAQFKCPCDFNAVSEGMALWIMPNFIKKRLASSMTDRMDPRGDAHGKNLLLKAGEEQITAYVEAVNYLLKSYATNSNITKVTLEIAWLKKVSNETSV